MHSNEKQANTPAFMEATLWLGREITNKISSTYSFLSVAKEENEGGSDRYDGGRGKDCSFRQQREGRSHCKGGIWMRHEGLKGEGHVGISMGGGDIPGRRSSSDKGHVKRMTLVPKSVSSGQ